MRTRPLSLSSVIPALGFLSAVGLFACGIETDGAAGYRGAGAGGVAAGAGGSFVPEGG
jgi:hypothetical protein